MGWSHAVPGLILLVFKITGTSLFLAFIPQIFTRGNVTFVPVDNDSVLQTDRNLLESSTTSPGRPPTTVIAPIQEPRWESNGGNSYGFSQDMLEWIASQEECKDRSSALVIINDNAEMEFLLNQTRSDDYFIGLVYLEEDNKWLWLDGTEPMRNLFNMKPNELDKSCATLRGREVSPTSCHEKKRWICEKTGSSYS